MNQPNIKINVDLQLQDTVINCRQTTAVYLKSSNITGAQCRICLGDESEGMISPCRCAGSHQFVHEKCLLAWLEIKLKYLVYYCASLDTSVDCEICKQPISVRYQRVTKCNSLSLIRQAIEEKTCTFLALLLGIVFSLSLLTFLIYRISISLGFIYEPSLYILMSAAIFFTALVLLFFMSQMIPLMVTRDCELRMLQGGLTGNR